MATIGLLGLSDPVKEGSLVSTLTELRAWGHKVCLSPFLFQAATPKERASIFNDWMAQPFDFIFDVSGGDLANETLRYLDFDVYQQSHAIFHGYSDLTCVLNALATYRSCVLFQIKHNQNKQDLKKYLAFQSNDLYMGSGLGGNIRCFLKLAGTQYFPNLTGVPLYLESRSGNAYRIRSFFAQLEDMGVIDQIASLTLGEFTQLEAENDYDVLCTITSSYPIPVSFHAPFGHGKHSKAVRLEG